MPQRRRWFFLQILITKKTGGHFNNITVKRHIRVSRCSMCKFIYKKLMKHYLTNILKSYTSSYDVNEKVDHWLYSFENTHKKYIIMPLESLNYLFLEESLYITVWSPPGFINRNNETRCHLNATIQMSYCNFIFRLIIINIDSYTMMIDLDYRTNIFSIIIQRSWLWRGYRNILVRYL